MIRNRLVLPVLAASAALVLLAGCGGGDSSSSSDPASLAPANSPVFLEGSLRPQGQLKSNVDALASQIAGIDNLGDFVVSELESSAADSGEDFDYETEVEPWLGEEAGLFLSRFDGDDFTGYGIAIPTSDPDAAQKFVDTQAESGDDPVTRSDYEGVDYLIEEDDGTAIGIIGDFLFLGEDEQALKDAVDASNGDSLADAETYTSAIGNASEGSFLDVFVDVGGLIELSGEEIDEQALEILRENGIDPTEATAVASLVPGRDEVEIEVSSDLGGEGDPPSGDASELLGSLPADSFAALALPGLGEQLKDGIDSLDASGIPGEVPPKQLKSTLKATGLDLDQIAGSIEDAALFAQGSNESSLGGAVVLTTDGSGEATESVANIGRFLRAANVTGVTAVSGNASGFSIRDPEELGPKPLVVATKGDRIGIGYGLAPTLQALGAQNAATLADNASYKEAVSALGGTPISGFIDGSGALKLAQSLVPSSEEGFQEAKPYLAKIGYVAFGGGTEDGRATVKLIVGLK